MAAGAATCSAISRATERRRQRRHAQRRGHGRLGAHGQQPAATADVGAGLGRAATCRRAHPEDTSEQAQGELRPWRPQGHDRGSVSITARKRAGYSKHWLHEALQSTVAVAARRGVGYSGNGEHGGGAEMRPVKTTTTASR